MDSGRYRTSYAAQRKMYPELNAVYRNGQTPEQVRASIKRHTTRDLAEIATMSRPAEGWTPGSFEAFHESANGARVSRMDRFTFGTMYGNAAEVFYHRVFYNDSDRSIGWYVTRD